MDRWTDGFKGVIYILEIQPPYKGFFLAPAEGYSLRLHQKGLLGAKVVMSDKQTDKQTNERTDGQMNRRTNGRMNGWMI